MPDILSQLFTLSTLVFCVTIFVLVWVQRRIIELTFPEILNAKYWRELIIPIWPIATGSVVAAFMSSYPYPDIFKNTWSTRAAFGIFCGLFSGFIYRLIKKNLLEKLGQPSEPNQTFDNNTDQIQ